MHFILIRKKGKKWFVNMDILVRKPTERECEVMKSITGNYIRNIQTETNNNTAPYENLQFFYHPDHIGSSNYITDVNGEVYQHLEYFPSGETFVEQRKNTEYTTYYFSGKELDTETGLYYFGARFYDPRVGIFLTVDPMLDKYPSISSYAYCVNNPIRLIDPDGRNPLIVVAGGAAAYYVTARAMEKSTGNIKTRQTGYAMQHPINAARVGEYKPGSDNISTIASNFQINVAKASGLTTGEEGDQGNAYRHALWQGIITNEMGAKHAERIGNAHETHTNIDLNQRTFENMGDADRTVDILNNAIGREIGEKNKGESNKTIAKAVAKEFFAKGLWTVSGNETDGYSIQKTKITREQYNSAVREINKKGNNGLNE